MSIKLYILFFFLIGFEVVYAQSYMDRPNIKVCEKRNSNTGISIYPNPAMEFFIVNTNESVSKVEIFNIIGKKIKILDNDDSNRFDVSDLRNGIYLVRIFGKHNKVLKVIRIGINKQQP